MEHPEASLIRRTFILREMDLPPQVQLTKRSLLRWFALSFGMISPNESRDSVLDILDALFYFQFQQQKDPTVEDFARYWKEKNMKEPISEKLLRYHLNRLVKLNLLVRNKKHFSVNPAPYAERKNFKESFHYWVREHVEKSLKDLEWTTEKLQDMYHK
jgi:hypothetical protein